MRKKKMGMGMRMGVLGSSILPRRSSFARRNEVRVRNDEERRHYVINMGAVSWDERSSDRRRSQNLPQGG
jgi:hypothetical protein